MAKQGSARKRPLRSGPVRIGNVVAEIMSRKGLGRRQSVEQREEVWRDVVGSELAAMTRCGDVRRRRLEVIVANSMLIQELTFRKQELIAGLNQQLPELEVQDIRFRIGQIKQ